MKTFLRSVYGSAINDLNLNYHAASLTAALGLIVAAFIGIVWLEIAPSLWIKIGAFGFAALMSGQIVCALLSRQTVHDLAVTDWKDNPAGFWLWVALDGAFTLLLLYAGLANIVI